MLRLPFPVRNPVKYIHWSLHYDYSPTGCEVLPREIEQYFPLMRKLRSFNRNVPHSARIDERFPTVGWVSWDEATLLYNYGNMFSGKKMLEIGCWVGWSTVALALSGLKLTVVDPVLENMPQGDACRDSLARARLMNSVDLVPGFSPAKVEQLSRQGESWDIFFIDGNHDGDAPLQDARMCAELAPEDSIILLHDLIQPNIAEALLWLQNNGWQCGVHYTSMFMGVAWRGNRKPIQHTADPRINWQKLIDGSYPHLRSFQRI